MAYEISTEWNRSILDYFDECGLDSEEFRKMLIQFNCVIAGSFVLQKVVGDSHWKPADVDIFHNELFTETTLHSWLYHRGFTHTMENGSIITNIEYTRKYYHPTIPIVFNVVKFYDNILCTLSVQEAIDATFDLSICNTSYNGHHVRYLPDTLKRKGRLLQMRDVNYRDTFASSWNRSFGLVETKTKDGERFVHMELGSWQSYVRMEKIKLTLEIAYHLKRLFPELIIDTSVLSEHRLMNRIKKYQDRGFECEVFSSLFSFRQNEKKESIYYGLLIAEPSLVAEMDKTLCPTLEKIKKDIEYTILRKSDMCLLLLNAVHLKRIKDHLPMSYTSVWQAILNMLGFGQKFQKKYMFLKLSVFL